jgi:hypothetical protein
MGPSYSQMGAESASVPGSNRLIEQSHAKQSRVAGLPKRQTAKAG